MKNLKQLGLFVIVALAQFKTSVAADLNEIRYQREKIEDLEIFYREAGDPKNPGSQWPER